MIALVASLPLLRVGEFDLVSYDANWLARELKSSAAACGEADWSPAEDVARGMITYLRYTCPATAVTLDFLTQTLRPAVANVGFPEIARCLTLGPPAISVDLFQLTRQSDSLPILFFTNLEARLKSLNQAGAQQIQLTECRAACLALAGRRIWGRRSTELQQELACRLHMLAPQAECK